MSLIRQYNRPIALTSSTIGNLFVSGSNLGIKINPTANLDVSGGLRITSGNLSSTFNSNTIGGILITTGGNIGINTSSPNYRLDVRGTIRINHPSPNGLYIGGIDNGAPGINIVSSHGNLDLGIASGNGSYSGSAIIGDAVIRSAANRALILQRGTGGSALYLTTSGNVAINTTSQSTRLNISPLSTEAKITLWDGGSLINHYGFGVSANQLNYHSSGAHVFYSGGKNGDGTELLRITSNGLLQSSNFKTIQVYASNSINWANINSSNFTVGSGSKFLMVNYSWWNGSAGRFTAYFDIYTSTNTLITTYTQVFYINQGGTHIPGTFLYVIPNSTMPAGTYYIKFRHNAISDGNDYLYASLMNFPFN